MRYLITSIILYFIVANQALACSCVGTTLEEAFKSADLVFEGEFISAAPAQNSNVPTGDNVVAYTVMDEQNILVGKFRVTREIKGIGHEFRFIRYVKADGGNCGTGFAPEVMYRVYANKNGDEFVTGGCMRTGPLSMGDIERSLPKDEDAAFEAICTEEDEREKRWLQYLILAQAQEEQEDLYIENYVRRFEGISEADLEGKISAARHAHEFRDFERAVSIWSAIAQENPDDIRGQLGLSKSNISLGTYAAALSAAQQAIQIDKDMLDAQELFAKSLLLAEGKSHQSHRNYRAITAKSVSAQGVALPGADFSNGDFIEFDISDATLPNSRFVNFSARQGIFKGADLRGSVFDYSGHYLTTGGHFSPDFSDADLTNARLIDISARGANFTNTNLRSAKLQKSSLSGAPFNNSRLYNSDFSEAYLYAADFSNTNVQNANFTKADLRKANLIGTNLRRAKLDETKFGAARISCTTRLPANFSIRDAGLIPIDPQCGNRPQNRDFSNKPWDYADFSNLDLRNASFNGAHIQQTNFRQADLTDADFRNSDGYSVIFGGANLTNADFSKSDITGSFAKRIHYQTGEELRPANLSNTNFSGAKISTQSFLNDYASGVEFDLDLSTANFQEAEVRCQADRYRRAVERYETLISKPDSEKDDYEKSARYLTFLKRDRDDAITWLQAEGELVRYLASKWPSVELTSECQGYLE